MFGYCCSCPVIRADNESDRGARVRPPEVLKLEDAQRPEPKDDQVLIRVIAAGVNPVDAHIRTGKSAKYFGTTLPFIPGYDIAGIVEKAGTKISKLKVGDPVYAYVGLDEGGGYAEYAVATETEAAPKPTLLTFESAAAVPLAALTAWQALIDAAKLSAGQIVLIHGGSGGVGSFAIQIAKARGAKVIATASTPHQDFLKQLGAGVAIDYTKQKFEDIAKDVDCCARHGWQRHARAFLRRNKEGWLHRYNRCAA
jgi:NADPH:quinone reductase-like Zn-dependent oxidoreductase